MGLAGCRDCIAMISSPLWGSWVVATASGYLNHNFGTCGWSRLRCTQYSSWTHALATCGRTRDFLTILVVMAPIISAAAAASRHSFFKHGDGTPDDSAPEIRPLISVLHYLCSITLGKFYSQGAESRKGRLLDIQQTSLPQYPSYRGVSKDFSS